MSGLSAAALIVARLRPPPVPGLDEDLAHRDWAVTRLGCVLAIQLVLFVVLTLAVR
ncbi:hypothetical protein [Roseomonas sp. AR75]|uniref:hypothetical protein n=1 Tax=Roseomonas sp. AR75 TaxID=2562311 RepID=UPI001484DB87|nr:hypothetical protein [Roseomonas sp. AR75]